MEPWRTALKNKSCPTACVHKKLWCPIVNCWKDAQIPLARPSLSIWHCTLAGKSFEVAVLDPLCPKTALFVVIGFCLSSGNSLFWATYSLEVILSFKELNLITFLCLALPEKNLGCLISDVLPVVLHSPTHNSVGLKSKMLQVVGYQQTGRRNWSLIALCI